jgi:hypothetical protein
MKNIAPRTVQPAAIGGTECAFSVEESYLSALLLYTASSIIIIIIIIIIM